MTFNRYSLLSATVNVAKQFASTYYAAFYNHFGHFAPNDCKDVALDELREQCELVKDMWAFYEIVYTSIEQYETSRFDTMLNGELHDDDFPWKPMLVVYSKLVAKIDNPSKLAIWILRQLQAKQKELLT
jgi:hypothetical protein